MSAVPRQATLFGTTEPRASLWMFLSRASIMRGRASLARMGNLYIQSVSCQWDRYDGQTGQPNGVFLHRAAAGGMYIDFTPGHVVSAPIVLNTDKTINLNHTLADNGTYRMVVKVFDDDGDVGQDYFTVTVQTTSPQRPRCRRQPRSRKEARSSWR